MNTEKTDSAFPVEDEPGARGLTAIEHAAIQLRVPTSGTAWLDDMIREARRWDMATAIMTASESTDVGGLVGQDVHANYGRVGANILLAKLDNRGGGE